MKHAPTAQGTTQTANDAWRADNQQLIIRRILMNRVVAVVAKVALTSTVLMCSGCAVVAVTGAVVTVAATVVSTGVKATGAVIGAVIPDSDD